MKIKFTQFDEKTREIIGVAVLDYANSIKRISRDASKKYFDISQTIIHGELIIGEYQYNEQEKGGDKQ